MKLYETHAVCMVQPCDPDIRQEGVTPIDSIVTAATVLVNLYTKEGVKLLRILPYTSINVRVVNGH